MVGWGVLMETPGDGHLLAAKVILSHCEKNRPQSKRLSLLKIMCQACVLSSKPKLMSQAQDSKLYCCGLLGSAHWMGR